MGESRGDRMGRWLYARVRRASTTFSQGVGSPLGTGAGCECCDDDGASESFRSAAKLRGALLSPSTPSKRRVVR